MTRVFKFVAATATAAVALAAAFFLHPRSGARRRAAVRRESANVAALVGSAIDKRPRVLKRRRSDDGLEDRVRGTLDAIFGDEIRQITVRARDGVLTLRGEVDDLRDITQYEETVRAMPGVLDVDNLLRMRFAAVARPTILSA